MIALFPGKCKGGNKKGTLKRNSPQIGRPQASKEDISATFLRHYPAHKNGQLNVSELARVCDISRPTAYKYIGLLEC